MIGLTWDELPRNDTDYLFRVALERIQRREWLTAQGYPQNIHRTVEARRRLTDSVRALSLRPHAVQTSPNDTDRRRGDHERLRRDVAGAQARDRCFHAARRQDL